MMSIGMPRNPQSRFLLFALVWFAAVLAIWWMLLLDPMLSALRSASELVLHFLPGGSEVAQIRIQPDGNWLLRIPLPKAMGKLKSTQKIFGYYPQDGKPVKVRSASIPMERQFPALFTVGLPFFWALWFAAPYGPNSLPAFLAGSLVLAIVSVISLVFYTFCAVAVVLHFTPAGAEGFLLDMGRFLVLNIIPYAGPVLLAIGLNRGIQRLVLEGAAAPAPANIVRRTGRAVHSKRLRRGIAPR